MNRNPRGRDARHRVGNVVTHHWVVIAKACPREREVTVERKPGSDVVEVCPFHPVTTTFSATRLGRTRVADEHRLIVGVVQPKGQRALQAFYPAKAHTQLRATLARKRLSWIAFDSDTARIGRVKTKACRQVQLRVEPGPEDETRFRTGDGTSGRLADAANLISHLERIQITA